MPIPTLTPNPIKGAPQLEITLCPVPRQCYPHGESSLHLAAENGHNCKLSWKEVTIIEKFNIFMATKSYP